METKECRGLPPGYYPRATGHARLDSPSMTTEKDQEAEAPHYQEPVGHPGTTVSPLSGGASASWSSPMQLSGCRANKRPEL